MLNTIKLDVNWICHGCPNFTPDLITLEANGVPVDQRVVCLNQTLCNRIELYIRRELQKENENA